MTWLLFVVAAFAVYRVGRMVAEEDGPAFVFKRLRDSRTNDKRAIDVGLRCFYCVSFWAALAATLFLTLVAHVDYWLWPIWWFGIAGGAAKIYEFWRR